MSTSQVFRAKRKAINNITGTSTEQYGMLWDYIEEVKRTNPGTIVLMKVKHYGTG